MVLKEELWPAACKKSRAAAKLNKNVLTNADSWFDCFDWVGSIFFTVPNVYMGEYCLFKEAAFLCCFIEHQPGFKVYWRKKAYVVF
jgi:hypothetical protein